MRFWKLGRSTKRNYEKRGERAFNENLRKRKRKKKCFGARD